MRVLFVTPYYKPAHLGGIERAIERLAGALHAGGHVEGVGIMTTRYAFPPRYVAGLPLREVVDGWLAIYRLPSRPQTPVPLFPYYSCPVTYFAPRAMRAVLRVFRPDIIHIVGDGWVWAHLWLLACRHPATAVVFTPSFHDLAGSRTWLRLPNTVLAGRAERTVVLTEVEHRAVAAAYRPLSARLVTIPWGVVIPPPLPPRGASGGNGVGVPSKSAGKPLTILCVGRLGEHKGQRWLLETYLRARPAMRCRTQLLFVGADEGGPGGRASLDERIRDAGLEGEVVLTGVVDDATLERHYQDAAVFALFSRYEAFGLVFVEALAHGVPVLTHRVGANAAVLKRGAVLTGSYDVAAATAALVDLVNNPAERRRLGTEGRAFVQENYSWEIVATHYWDTYTAALAERRRAPRATQGPPSARGGTIL